jgi:hypothetical protein
MDREQQCRSFPIIERYLDGFSEAEDMGLAEVTQNQ